MGVCNVSQPHEWVPSTLGHGETMCRYCGITNREAAVLNQLNAACPNRRRPASATRRYRDEPRPSSDDGFSPTPATSDFGLAPSYTPSSPPPPPSSDSGGHSSDSSDSGSTSSSSSTD